MTDEEIALALQERGLEIEYLRELAAALGFSEEEGWTMEIFTAMEHATHDQRRSAALRVLALADE